MRQGFFQDPGSNRIPRRHQTVVHPAPLPPRGDKAGAAEVGQVARNFRLADSEGLDEIADAYLLVGEEVEQAQPSLVGQGAEEDDETTEDTINRLMEARKLLPNASYFAFTATPKNKTLEIFGEAASEGEIPCTLCVLLGPPSVRLKQQTLKQAVISAAERI